MGKGIISGVISDLFGGVAKEMSRQIYGGHSKKKSSGSRPLVIRNYRISHNHYHLHRKRKKNPFDELYKAIKEKD